jgi:phage baseplate assembly protein W
MPDDSVLQFDLPFRLDPTGRDVVTVVQDTLDDVENCVQALRRTPLGFFESNPDYGMSDQTFEEGGELDLNEFQTAIGQFEPRADAMISETPDLLDYFVHNIDVKVSAKPDA